MTTELERTADNAARLALLLAAALDELEMVKQERDQLRARLAGEV